MTLAQGARLGAYEILAPLGAGGMGEVYRARDTRLGREVAIKVLPQELTSDPERLRRFEREARTASALSHPNIVTIYDVGREGAVSYLAMEFVAGSTLRELLAEGPLSVKGALAIAADVAQGLARAHAAGIVHRDLKPENVMVGSDGFVKILDFGLAKLTRPESDSAHGTHFPTVSLPTEAGVVMGTVGYMSPEQASGLPVDFRSDQFSLGAVMYEVLSGQRAFAGASAAQTLAAIIESEPEPITSVNPRVPAPVGWIVERCLAKDMKRRYASTEDLAGDLATVRDRFSELGGAGEQGREMSPIGRAGSKGLGLGAIALGAAVAGLLCGALATWVGMSYFRREGVKPAIPVRFEISLPGQDAVLPRSSPQVALSPDGTRLVYAVQSGSKGMLFLRRMDQFQAKPIPGTEGGAAPFFSPDGGWVGFRHPASRTIKKIALSGGAPVMICETGDNYGVSWGPDDTLVLTPQTPSGLARVPATGGKPEPLTKLDVAKGERNHRFAQILPGGKAVLFTISDSETESYDDARIAVQSLETGARKVLVEGGSCARYSPSGHLVYVRGGTLLAVPFDLKRLVVTGAPVPVLEGVFESVNNGAAQFTISADGSLAYIRGPAEGGKRLPVWVGRDGKAEPLPLPERPYLHPRISPNGNRLAIEIEGPNHDCFIYEPGRSLMTKVTFDGLSHWPLWTPDGSRLTFRSWRTGFFTMWWMPADRSAPEERLTMVGRMQSAASWSPEARVVAFTQVNPDTGADVYVLDRTAGREPQPFVRSKFAEASPRFSPDGKWLAYASNESGRNEIYAQPYPGPGAKIQISNEGGTDAVWKPSGGELFYRNADKMMVVAVTTSPTLTASAPKLLWEGHYSHGTSTSCGPPGTTSSNYDVTSDGKRFLMIRDRDQDANLTQINVVLHWSRELEQIAPAKKN